MSSLTPYGKNSTTTPKAAARPIPRAGKPKLAPRAIRTALLWRAVFTMYGTRNAREQTSGMCTYLRRVLMMISKLSGMDILQGKESIYGYDGEGTGCV